MKKVGVYVCVHFCTDGQNGAILDAVISYPQVRPDEISQKMAIPNRQSSSVSFPTV